MRCSLRRDCRLTVLLFVSLLVWTTLGGCSSMMLARRGGDGVELSPRDEHYLGRAVAARILDRYQPLSAPKLNAYVTRVIRVLASVSDRPETYGGYHAIVLDTDEPFVAGAPGGFVFISRGLLTRIPDEDTLAAALAGEVARIVAKTPSSLVERGDVDEAVRARGTLQGRASALDQSAKRVFSEIVGGNYGESTLSEGDLAAADLLDRAGYDVAALDRWLSMLETVARAPGVTHGQSHHAGARLARHPGTTSPSKASGADVQQRAKRYRDALQSARLAPA